MSSDGDSSSGGSYIMLFTLVLMVLKLSGNLQITWLWVFAPVWIPLAIAGGVLLIVALVLSLLKVFGIK